MSPAPRRLPPTQRERLGTVVSHMTPGALDGVSRMVQPVGVRQGTRPDISGSAGRILGDGVPFWWDQWTLTANQAPGRFLLTYIPINFSEHVYLNGVQQTELVAWTRPAGTGFLDVLGGMGARPGDVLEVRYAHGAPPVVQGDWVQLPDWVLPHHQILGNIHSATFTLLAQPGEFYPSSPLSPAWPSSGAAACAANLAGHLIDGFIFFNTPIPDSGDPEFSCPSPLGVDTNDSHGGWGTFVLGDYPGFEPEQMALGDRLRYPDSGAIGPAVGDVEITKWMTDFDAIIPIYAAAALTSAEANSWFTRTGVTRPAGTIEWERMGWASSTAQMPVGTLLSATMVPWTGEIITDFHDGASAEIRLYPTSQYFHHPDGPYTGPADAGELVATVNLFNGATEVARDFTDADLGWRTTDPDYGPVTYPGEPDPTHAGKPLIKDRLCFTGIGPGGSPSENPPGVLDGPGRVIMRACLFAATLDLVIRPPRYRFVGA